jgi:hypothetical protein
MTSARELRFVVVVHEYDVAAHLVGHVFELRALSPQPYS